ncbi:MULTISPECIES: glycosyl hydrolase family 65 protein [unclassified Oceanispirochaeta]|uniref:glycosyl hydrolase family 65 protein n=1 Tax=unclassified Oceanispirochaeta TaxID=2635722 RepID=UPI000E08CE4E|nr:MULTISPECIES: glycosyl hydrolase family 65 protein [unclassified Oceanispirochaeta]MBF9015802.1 glycoside hydrolase family 65 protein [Oceanispirochaeta sp. M2]NPD72265.1 glycoside hydrolase family 65 protein [Oceanispirochaeta sp. M1]RDG32361.1 glycoside hydrolase family 65 protein [Oceanispirochaeta sp. M1]
MKDDNSLWKISRSFKNARLNDELKTLLFCGNGFLGVQADDPNSHQPSGTYINGFFESTSISYGEKAYGFPSVQQVMIPLVDVLGWEIEEKTNDGLKKLALSEGIIELDMQKGIRVVKSTSRKPDGSILEITKETIASLAHPNRLYNRISLKGQGIFRIIRKIREPGQDREESDDPRKMESMGTDLFKDSSCRMNGKRCIIEETTRTSGMSYACALQVDKERGEKGYASGQFAEYTQYIDLSETEEMSSLLIAVFYSANDGDSPVEKAADELEEALKQDWTAICRDQEKTLSDFWSKADIRIDGKDEYTRALRYNSFALLQSTGTDPSKSGAAKGLSSGGYNGHYFWDADVYIQAALNNIDPARARNLVEYRIGHLKEARARASELSEAGALYPWRTIDGRECSAYFPAGTAQFHINADIIWGMKSFLDNSGERDLLLKGGAEMLFETARFWANFAVEVPDKGYCLHCVTGPDEYTALVNNNFYTNLMAREHLSYAFAIAMELSEEYGEFMAELTGRIGLDQEEINSWQKISKKFFLPKIENSMVYKQDDSFLEKSPWDWENTPEENRPLLLYYHPLKIYRHRVMKQPDVIMGLLLQKQYFSKEVFAANYDYYDPLTSGDSSLSSAVQSAAAALAGRMDDAEDHFRKNLFLDLDNREGNTDNGIHLAAMAGARIALLYGFADMEDTAEGLSFNPSFPDDWGNVSFSVVYRGVILSVKYDALEKSVSFKADAEIIVNIGKQSLSIRKDVETSLYLD